MDDDRIEALTRRVTEELTTEIREIIRDEVRERFEQVIAGETPEPAKRPRKRRAKAATKPKPATSSDRKRRSPEEIEKLDERIVAYIDKHPGCSGPDVMAGLKIDKGVWSRRIARLRDGQQRIRQEGERAGARYFPR